MAAASEKRSVGLRLFLNSFVVVWLIIAAFPFLWTLWGSFKVELDFFSIADWTNALTGH
ncbi:MAG: carbohydrate ABC transporter permease, partial [Marinovum sp.]|nr:carbohydrate ABC transporter permease [Marinovum sp.]